MGKQGYVFLDEAYLTDRRNSKIKLAGAAIGFREGLTKNNPNTELDIYEWWGIAKKGNIKKREMRILGMLVADGLVQLSKPKYFVNPKIYHTCYEIGSYTLPYLYDHEWRDGSNFDRRLRKRIAERIELTNCNTSFKKYYNTKQSIGKMLIEKLSEVRIPHRVMLDMGPLDVINLKNMEFVKPEDKPPPCWNRK